MKNNSNKINAAIKKVFYIFVAAAFLLVAMFFVLVFGADIDTWYNNKNIVNKEVDSVYAVAAKKAELQKEMKNFWKPVSIEDEKNPKLKAQLEYGKELIAHTSVYLGPKGSVKSISNGMNCQNCHLDAGTKPWGNNYGSVYSTYPKMRARSGKVEDLFKRINDCFERSLNGVALKQEDKEMQAMIAYINYIGKNVAKGEDALASGVFDLKLLDRAASPEKGKPLYDQKCASCHKVDGLGVMAADGKEYTYPPLWGKNSYNSGAGLFRISRFAGYIKYNMPLGASYDSSQLTDEESWDIAAYVESLPRPGKDLSQDWPNISKKPFDHPFGPFADKFSELQHKYGPFGPIKKAKKKMKEAEKKAKKV